MEKLALPEIFVPIILNLILAVTTIFYLLETRASRKAMVSQLKTSQRQHFVAIAPFIYVGSIKKIENSEDLTARVINPSDKLARDVSCVLYDHKKKAFCHPTITKVVIKKNQSSTFKVHAKPYTAEEVLKRLCKFYGVPEGIDSRLVAESQKSYILLLYTDVEGSIYSVKAEFSWNEDETITRQRSIFEKLNDPQII